MSQWDQTKAEMEKNRPKFSSLINPATGKLRPEFQLIAQDPIAFKSLLDDLETRLSGINLNTDALEAVRAQALDASPSAWAKLALETQGLEQAAQADSAARQSKAGIGSAYSALATRGGLSQGARERIARGGAKDLIDTRQAIQSAGATNRLGILTEDEKNRQALLAQLPGMEIAALSPEFEKTSMWGQMANSEAARQQALDISNRDYLTDVNKTNLGTYLSNWQAKNQYEMDKYKEYMTALGNERTAQAQENSAGGFLGSYICTLANSVEPFSHREWAKLMDLKKFAQEHRPEQAEFYFGRCNVLPTKMLEGGVNLKEVVAFVKEIIDLCDEDMELALDEYWTKLNHYIDEYAPELRG